MLLWGTTKQNIEFVIFAVYINNVFALLAHVQKITTLVSCVYNYIESDWMSILGADIFLSMVSPNFISIYYNIPASL